MFRNALLACLLALGAAGCTETQDLGPRLVGGGDEAHVVYSAPSRNVVGGGIASISGGGDNMQITYAPRPKTMAPTGLIAQLVGGGGDAQVVYHQAAPANTMVAGQMGPPAN